MSYWRAPTWSLWALTAIQMRSLCDIPTDYIIWSTMIELKNPNYWFTSIHMIKYNFYIKIKNKCDCEARK